MTYDSAVSANAIRLLFVYVMFYMCCVYDMMVWCWKPDGRTETICWCYRRRYIFPDNAATERGSFTRSRSGGKKYVSLRRMLFFLIFFFFYCYYLSCVQMDVQ
jgi:hypothetical protein